MASLLANTKIKTKFLIVPILISLILFGSFIILFQFQNQQFKNILDFSKRDLVYSQKLVIFIWGAHSLHDQANNFYNLSKESDSPQTFAGKRKKLSATVKRLLNQVKKLATQYPHSPESKEQIMGAYDFYKIYAQESLNLYKFMGQDHKKADELMDKLNRKYFQFRIATQGLQNSITQGTKQSILKFQQQAREEFYIMLVTSGVLCLSLIVLSIFLARYMSRPVVALAETIGEICKTGNYEIRAQKNTGGEIGDLIDGFNQMLFEIGRATNSFETTKDLFFSFTESLTEPLLVTDRKGLIKKVNQKALGSLGYFKNEIIDQPLDSIAFYPEHPEPKPFTIQDAIYKADSSLKSMLLKDKSGDFLEVQMSTFIMKDRDESITGSISLAYLEVD